MQQEVSLASRAAHSFILVDRTHHKVVDRYIGEIGLHRSEHMLLMELSKSNGAESQTLLAQRLRISPCALSVRIKKLESDGYIERGRCDDNRIKNIAITARGQEVVKHSREMFAKVDNAMVSGLSEEELLRFMDILEKMNRNLNALYTENGNL